MAKTMWQFKTRNFTVRWVIEPDVLCTQHMDPELAKECIKNVRSRKWKCFQSEIEVVCNTTGVSLGQAYLGGSIYANPAEFRDHFGMSANGHGSYFVQMVREAIAQAREQFPLHQKRAAQALAKNQKVLDVKLSSTTKFVAV
ncbi:MAG: hypothetical protein Q7S87_05160 [Agitococcus sp.]|nr:hypothetical protein [Agitococcus sp.]